MNQNTTTITTNEDRLSALPDCLLTKILSNLPIHTAISTTTLSKRYTNLCPHLTSFIFSPLKPTTNHNIFTIITKTLTTLTSPTLTTFTLLIPPPTKRPKHYWSHLSHHFQPWLIFACNTKHAKHINIHIIVDHLNPLIPLPSCIFESKTLLSLTLSQGLDYNLPESGEIQLPSLVKLDIFLLSRHREVMCRLFKSCPKIEDLTIRGWFVEGDDDDHCFDIRGGSLVNLRLCVGGMLGRFVVDAPNLRCVCVDGRLYWNFGLELARGISNVWFLELCDIGLFRCRLDDDFELPLFGNLVSLKTVLCSSRYWGDLICFLRFSPNLEVLVVEKDYEVDGVDVVVDACGNEFVPCCLATKVKRISMSNLLAVECELRMVRFILRNANVLETLELNVADFGKRKPEVTLESKVMDFYKELCKLTNSSLSCEIKFSSSFLNASWTV